MQKFRILIFLPVFLLAISCSKEEEDALLGTSNNTTTNTPTNGNPNANLPQNTRYLSEIFDDFEWTTNLEYGNNQNLVSENVSVTLDLFEPLGDVEEQRPVVILAGGGGFAKMENNNLEALAQKLARSGYVCALINHRTLPPGIPANRFYLRHAILDAAADAKAAVRFFRYTEQNGNTYRIDPNKIFLGGYSTGAVAALHGAYLNDPEELSTEIFEMIKEKGGVEGNSGHPGFSSKVNGTINLSGALMSLAYLNSGEAPIFNFHGDQDQTIPAGSEAVATLDDPLMYHGGQALHQQAQTKGVASELHLLAGGSHISTQFQITETGNFDALLNFLYRNF